jgi:hypothetical protein
MAVHYTPGSEVANETGARILYGGNGSWDNLVLRVVCNSRGRWTALFCACDSE